MKILSTTLALFCISIVFAQPNYWQQQLNYKINVELLPNHKLLVGDETINYKNNSPDRLTYIWFHIYPNAYKNKKTALFKQLSKLDRKKNKTTETSFGYIDSLDFKVNGTNAKFEIDNENIDVIKLILNEPLISGDSIIITTPFKVKLPSYFSRSGYDDDEFMICQWYPKPAVYDINGWHQMPYLDMGEFYSEYGNYNVSITIPKEYVVAATGVLNDKKELEIYKSIGKQNATNKQDNPKFYPVNTDAPNLKTLVYNIENSLDFAWFADKDFIIQYDTLNIGSNVVDAFTFYHKKSHALWVNSIDYVKKATKFYSDKIGDYAYPTVQAVEGPANNSSGGMEYPTITLITSPDAEQKTLDAVIAHEVGHNWFMAMLGSNERKHAWQDEGLNSYFQFWYEAELNKYNSIFGKNIPEEMLKLPTPDFLSMFYKVILSMAPEEPIETESTNFKNSNDYGLVAYLKTASWMHIIETSIGQDKLLEAVQLYFKKHRFKHVYPNDLKQCFEEVTNKKMNLIFDLLSKKGKLL
jgi:hypothetical protein